MAIKQNNVMPISLVVRNPDWLTRCPHEGISFLLDEESNGLPTVITTIEDEQKQEQSVEVTLDPYQLDWLIEELKKLQMAVQWQMARSYWHFVRYGSSGEWHLRQKQWLDGHLCSSRPRYQTTKVAVVEAAGTLWDGRVCRECVRLWTDQILSGFVRYQYASTPSLSANTIDEAKRTFIDLDQPDVAIAYYQELFLKSVAATGAEKEQVLAEMRKMDEQATQQGKRFLLLNDEVTLDDLEEVEQ